MVGSGTFTYGAGNEVNAPNYHPTRSYQVLDTLSWQKGSHRIRFGFDYERTHTGVTSPGTFAIRPVSRALLTGAGEVVRRRLPGRRIRQPAEFGENTG